MAVKWRMTGDWVNACNCNPGCPCLFYSDPTQGQCNTIDAFHIRAGKYGAVNLAGLNVVLVGLTPGNFWKGNWRAALYLDERANPKQREALETVFGGKAGGPPKMLAGLIGTMLGVKYTKIEVDARRRYARIPDVLEFKLEPNLGGDKKPITLTHHPLYPAVGTLTMSKSVSGYYRDYGVGFDTAGRDGNTGPINFSGP